MTAIGTAKFRVLNAKKFIEQTETDSDKNMYHFVGRSMPWTDETTPDTTKDSVTEDIRRRSDMLALKKIQSSNVSHLIPRFDYDTTHNTKYVAYSPDDENLYFHPTTSEINDANTGSYLAGSFYVMTDELNVYKCLFQPKDNLGVPKKSTVQPTGRATSAFKTADGYIWRYMYTISASETLKYITNEWIPVKKVASDDGSNQWAVQQAAVDGSIEVVKVTVQGVGYDYTFTGSPQTVDTTTSLILPSGASSVDQAYQNGTLYVDSGPGAGTSRPIASYVGSTKRLVVTGAWSVGNEPTSSSVITIVPSVTITGDGTGATARATVTSGKITSIDIVAIGANYRYATATIAGCYNSGAIGATLAAATAVISPIGGHGADAVQELGGFFVCVNSKLLYNESDFPANNDYRRNGIIVNVQNANGTIATAPTLSATKTLSINGITGTFSPDELITSNGSPAAQARVVEFTSTGPGAGTLRYIQNESTGFTVFAPAQNITGTGGATASIVSLVASEIKNFSGDVIYIENRRNIMRSPNQLEDLRMIIEF